MKINFHIERLILDDLLLKQHQREELKINAAAELSRLLQSDGLGSGIQSGNHFRVISKDLVPDSGKADPSHLGRMVAQAIYRSMNK